MRSNGLGLGLAGGDRFTNATEESVLHLAVGELCILYTDGITESRNAEGDEFGYERLQEASLRFRDGSANEVKNRILETVRTFTGNPTYDDDMTLVVLKWKGNGSVQRRSEA